MPEDKTPPTPEEGEEKQKKVVAQEVAPPTPEDDDSTPEDERTVSWADHRKVKSEAASLRKRLKAALAGNGKDKDASGDDDGDINSLRQKLKVKEDREEELLGQIRQRDARDSVIAVLASNEENNRYRAINAKAVWNLIRPDLEIDEDGTVLNLIDVLRSAKKEYPELFTGHHATADSGTRQKTAGGGSFMNEQIRRIAGR